MSVKIGEYETENSACEKLLGVKLDWKLNFIILFLIYAKKLVEPKSFSQNCTIYRIIQVTCAKERRFLILNLVIVPSITCSTEA